LFRSWGKTTRNLSENRRSSSCDYSNLILYLAHIHELLGSGENFSLNVLVMEVETAENTKI
jgi:Na+-transporting NADH:ubiquinone oxidoreductase subunit NqrD